MSERTDLDGTYYSGAAQAERNIERGHNDPTSYTGSYSPDAAQTPSGERKFSNGLAVDEYWKIRDEMTGVAQDVPGSREATLKMVADLFTKSVHETYTREEVVSVIEDMIRLGSPVQSEHLEAATKLLKEVMPLLEDQGYLPEVRKIRAVLKEIEATPTQCPGRKK
jgi:hypothetical protein